MGFVINKKFNKKANIPDILMMMVILFGIVIFLVILYYIWTQVSPELNIALDSVMPDGDATYSVNTTSTQVTDSTLTFDSMMPLVIVGLLIMVLVSAFMVRSHPVFFFISIMVLAIFITLSAVFSNVYQTITDDSELSTTSSDFSITNLFMDKLPYIILIVTVLTFIILWGKPWSTSNV